ncbi:MAG: WG repeat-containing protein [Lachnospiraceae bacterium]
MQCNNCGKQNNEVAKFCKYCGQNLESQVTKQKKGNKKIIIVLIAAALIVLIVGGYFVIKPRISNNSNQTDNGYEETMDRGNKYLESMDYEKAELEYLDAINIEPKEEEAYVELAELYVVWGKPEEAKKIVAEGIANVPAEKQNKLPEKEVETADYLGYTWVTEPLIEADDIYYVQSVSDGTSCYNLSDIQKESAYAVIKEGDTLGLIDLTGELKASLEYDNISGNNIYLLSRKEAKYEEEYQMDWKLYGLVDDEVIPITYGGDAPDWYYYYGNELHSLYEVLSGTEIDEPETPIPIQKSDELSPEYNELSGLYGIFDQGKLTVDFIYEECGTYSQGLLAAKKDGKWGYVDSEGNEVIPFDYDASWKQYADTFNGTEEQDYCYAASGGYVVLCKDGVWELRNTQGKVVLPAGYFEKMRPVYEDQCWVKKDGKWGVIQIGSIEEQGDETESNTNVEEIYQKVLNQYKQAIDENYYRDILDGVSDDEDIIGEYINMELLSSSRYYDEFYVYYAFEDVDDNGMSELLIGASDATTNNRLYYDIFSTDGNKPIRIFEDMEFGYRTNFFIYSDGIIEINWSGSAFDNGYEFYSISTDGYTPELKESISMHGNHETPSESSKYYHDTDGVLEITETEYNQIYSSYEEKEEYKINWIELNNNVTIQG